MPPKRRCKTSSKVQNQTSTAIKRSNDISNIESRKNVFLHSSPSPSVPSEAAVPALTISDNLSEIDNSESVYDENTDYDRYSLSRCDEGDHSSVFSLAYKPKQISNEAAILLDDDLKEINKVVTRLFPKSLAQCPRLLKTCLICDENTSTGISPNQINLIDTDLVPGILNNPHFDNTRVFILHHELLLGKSSTQQCAIVSQLVHAAIEETFRGNRRGVIYIPRLERFWNNFDSPMKLLIEEKIMQVSTKPVLIIATTCWTITTLPEDLEKIFKGPASSHHVMGTPSPENINFLLQKILPGHEIFNADGRCENARKMLVVIKEWELPQLRQKAVNLATGKPTSVILTLYYTLKMYCDLDSDWESTEHLESALYFLMERLKTATGAV